MTKLIVNFLLLLIFIGLEVEAIRNLVYLKANVHGDLIAVLFILLTALNIWLLMSIEDISDRIDKNGK